MNRRTTLATAAAVTLVVLAGSAAAATNMGLLDSANETGNVGSLTPQTAVENPSEVDTVIVEPAAQARTTVEERARVDDNAPATDDDARPDLNCLAEDDDDDDRSSFDCLYDRDQDRERDQDHDEDREHDREHDGWEDDD